MVPRLTTRTFTRVLWCCDPVTRPWSLDHFLGHCGLESTMNQGWSRDDWISMFDHKKTTLRTCLSQSCVWEYIKEDTFYVCPEEWPEEARESFQLEDVPTPYEVACRFIVDVRMNGHLTPCDIAALWWWLAGMPPFVMEELGFDLKVQLPRVITALCSKIGFKVWALGTDLVPATAGDPEAMMFIQALQTGKPVSELGKTAASRGAWIYESPWVQGQLLSGKRLLPTQRFLRYPDYFFQTVKDKKARFPLALV